MGQVGLERDQGIDAVRGLAIVAMVNSHLGWECSATDATLLVRGFDSVAAPIFITLAGLLAAQTQAARRYPLNHYLTRGALIVLVGCAVDVLLWGLSPLIGMDVLYLIGLALPLTAAFSRLPRAWQTGILILVPVVAELLRRLAEYPEDVLCFTLDKSPLEIIRHGPAVLHQWLLSGWFPLLPWLFFAFLGGRVAAWQQQLGPAAFRRRLRVAGFGLVGLGAIALGLVPPPLASRGGYEELFYPPTVAYVGVAGGVVLALLSIRDAFWLRANRPLVVLGQCSLLMYVVHLALIHWCFGPLFPEMEGPAYWVAYFTLLAMLVGFAEVVGVAKRRWARKFPFVLRFLLGS